jgi:antitoxin component of MazEF toxin-antitoxin module
MPVTDRRKVVEVGGSLAVTLPKGWVDFFRLRPGEELGLVVDTPVVVFPRGLTREQKVEALEKIKKLIELLPEEAGR